MSLFREDDHQQLTTDPTIYTPSSNKYFFLQDGYFTEVSLPFPVFPCAAVPPPKLDADLEMLVPTVRHIPWRHGFDIMFLTSCFSEETTIAA
jgi:hypothetical protein